MRKFLKQLRKGLRAACVTAALATCWNVGQSAQAAYNPDYNDGDRVTIQISGTISPAINDLSHVFLIFCTGASSWQSEFQAIELGNFAAGQDGIYSVQANVLYYANSYWIVAGLYGDLSSGQYIEGVNGVTLNARYNSQDIYHDYDSWNDFVYRPELEMFGYLLDDDIQNLSVNVYSEYKYMNGGIDWLDFTGSADLYDFSDPAHNGTVEINCIVIPEPMTILLLGSGGIVVLRRKRRKEQGD
jgi:hypothetical protein